MKGTLRRTKLCGKKSNKKTFSYPEALEDVIDQGLEYQYGDKDVFGITCGIFDAIGSIMIDFSDKSTTPMFGTE